MDVFLVIDMVRMAILGRIFLVLPFHVAHKRKRAV